MSAEGQLYSRRGAIKLGLGVATGLILSESEGLDRRANQSDIKELRAFLRQPIENQAVVGPSTANLLALVGRGKPSEVGFAHNANSLDKIDAFVLDDNRDVAEVDCRIDEDGLYISHSRGRKSDIDPITVYQIVARAPRPKALKYDFKEPEAVGGIIGSIEDAERPCILNADLFHNSKFKLTPEQFVEQSQGLTNALLSIGRKGDFGNMMDFVIQFTELAKEHPDRDFILPAHLIDFLGYFDELKQSLIVPNVFLMVYRTGDFTLTKRHIKWIKNNFPDDVRARTFFDL